MGLRRGLLWVIRVAWSPAKGSFRPKPDFAGVDCFGAPIEYHREAERACYGCR
jgi:hypothetical protein